MKDNVLVPLETLKKLPRFSQICGSAEVKNIFNDNKTETALIVTIRDDIYGLRKALFSVANGTYLGDH